MPEPIYHDPVAAKRYEAWMGLFPSTLPSSLLKCFHVSNVCLFRGNGIRVGG